MFSKLRRSVGPERVRGRSTRKKTTLRMGGKDSVRACRICVPFPQVLVTLIKSLQLGTAAPCIDEITSSTSRCRVNWTIFGQACIRDAAGGFGRAFGKNVSRLRRHLVRKLNRVSRRRLIQSLVPPLYLSGCWGRSFS
jgi:hypothetical protein